MSKTPFKIHVRASTDADVPAMLAIYHHHISAGLCDLDSGEDTGRLETEDSLRQRKNLRKHRLPHLVAEADGMVVGYAYAVPFRKRPAYRYTLKHSIYVHHQFTGYGIGKSLLPVLIDACAAGGYRQLICYIDAGNMASLRLHESLGFIRVGLLPAVAFKFGEWADSIILQRGLGPGAALPPGSWAATGSSGGSDASKAT
jgi:phosphinothricin acetyltransferase